MSGPQDSQRAFLIPAAAGRQYPKHCRLGRWPDLGYRLLLLLSGMMLFDGTPELVAVHKEQEEHLDVERTATAIVDFGKDRPAFHRVKRQ